MLFITVTNVIIKEKTKGHVKQNLVTQQGVLYSCNQCSYKSYWETDFKGHVEIQHEGVIYKCDQCSYKGTRNDICL